MVKVGILNADSFISGEILRILIHHPETEIISLHAPAVKGHSISSVHHGFIGEIPLIFSDNIDPLELDFLIVPEKSSFAKNLAKNIESFPELKIVSLDDKLFDEEIDISIETGLSEINRKALVRGARIAVVPSPVIVPALIALTPLANYLLLNSEIKIDVEVPEDIFNNINRESLKKDLITEIQKRQSSFNQIIDLQVSPSKSIRQTTTTIMVNNTLPLEEIEKIFDSTYDDHNFTFLSRAKTSPIEVEGTQKVVISLDKPTEDYLKINIVSDGRLRGGAGDVVHVMNLFYGLHEKTGLNLKASNYFN